DRLVTPSKVEGEIGADAKIVLDIEAENLVADTAIGTFSGHCTGEYCGIRSCQKIMDRIEGPVAERIMSHVQVVAYALDTESGPDIVPALYERQVVIQLERGVPNLISSRGAEAARRIRRE